MNTYTASRDYTPAARFGQHVPSNAVYARVVVVAPDLPSASLKLVDMRLAAYCETLRETTSADAPAKAVALYAIHRTEPAVFVVYRVDADALGVPLRVPEVLVAEIAGGELVARGRVVLVNAAERRYQVVSQGGPVARGAKAIPEEDEGPDAPAVPAAAPSVAGYLLAGRERALDSALGGAVADLEDVIATIRISRTMVDPRTRYNRASSELNGIVGRLADALATARQIVVLGDVVAGEER